MTPEEKAALDAATKDLVEKAVKTAIESTQAEAIANAKKVVVTKAEEDKIADRGGYESVAHFLSDIKCASQGNMSEKLVKLITAQKAVHGNNLATPADGGYLAPVEYTSIILTRTQELAIVLARALMVPMISTSIKVPGLDDYDRTNVAKGAPLGTITAEGASAPSVSKVAIEQITLTPVKVLVECVLSEELMEDSSLPAASAILNAVIPPRLANKLDTYFLTGTGSGQPLGMLHASNGARKAVAAGGSRAATYITAPHLYAMLAAHSNPDKAVWLVSRGLLPTIWALNDTAGIIVDAPGKTILGIPYIVSDKMAAKGTIGDIALVDCSQYYVGQRGGLRTASSIHVYWSTDEEVFRWAVRMDGRPGWTAPITGADSETFSPFVVLTSS